MNEHDSERIAGLLEAGRHGAGRRARRRRRDRPQHVLHPGERRQQALRAPRPPAGGQGPPAGPADRGGGLPGPEGPRPRAPQRRRTSTWCSAPTTWAGPPSSCNAPGATVRSPRSWTSSRSSRPRCPSSVRPATPPGSPSRSGATTAARSASSPRCGARRSAGPSHDVVAEVESLAADGVTEVTLLGQNVNSYGRDLALAARRDGGTGPVRPLFAELLAAVGSVDGIRRVRYTSPHPKDLRADTVAAMADGAGRVRAPPPPAAVRQRRGAGGHAPRLHGAALPRPAGARPVRRRRTWP